MPSVRCVFCVFVCMYVCERERDWIYFYHQVCNCAKLCKTFFFFHMLTIGGQLCKDHDVFKISIYYFYG